MLSNADLRRYLLRTVLVCSFISIPATIVVFVNGLSLITLAWVVVVCGITIHHTTTAVLTSKYFLELFEPILVSIEITVLFCLGLWKLVVNRWSTEDAAILTITLYTLVAALCLTLLLRVACIVRSKGMKLLKPFNVFSECDPLPRDWAPYEVVFGKAIWEPALAGEARGIIASRFLLAIPLLLALLLFSAISIIIEPIHEIGLVPHKDYRAPEILYDFNMEPPVWSIVAFIDMRLPIASHPDIFKTAITVKPLWDDSDVKNKPECVPLEGSLTIGGQSQNVQSDPYIQTITIFCPSRREGLTAREIMSAPSPDVSPDLLVTVNFTTLQMYDDSLVDARMRTVSILVGLTNNTNDVVSNTIPTPLFPGLNLVGNVSREFKRRFVKLPLSSWGIFSSSTSFLVTNLSPLFPDPSSLIPRSPDIGTLRIFGQNDHSDWELHQDYRDKSAWRGLASVGGFWTFLNGAFVIVLGTPLGLFLFGINQDSKSGVVHLLFQPRQLPLPDSRPLRADSASTQNSSGYHSLGDVPAGEQHEEIPLQVVQRTVVP